MRSPSVLRMPRRSYRPRRNGSRRAGGAQRLPNARAGGSCARSALRSSAERDPVRPDRARVENEEPQAQPRCRPEPLLVDSVLRAKPVAALQVVAWVDEGVVELTLLHAVGLTLSDPIARVFPGSAGSKAGSHLAFATSRSERSGGSCEGHAGRRRLGSYSGLRKRVVSTSSSTPSLVPWNVSSRSSS
jgi:hypothetical protein